VCLFATCMYMNISMDFAQSDAPSMRKKLAYLMYSNSQIPPHPTSITQSQSDDFSSSTIHNETHFNDPVDSTVKASSLPPQTDNNLKQTGYASIMNTSRGLKRKLPFGAPPRRRRQKIQLGHPSRKAPSASKMSNSAQQTIDDLLTRPTARRAKRRLHITDEDHPFKHKRYKEDEDE
jgi:hypothetical protein